LHDGTSKRLLINDLEENLTNVKNGKIRTISSGMGDTNCFEIDLNSSSTSPKLVLEKSSPKDRSFLIVSASIYDPRNKTITSVMRNNKKGWQNQIVWMKL
jgi:hypothetical protein